MPSNIIIIYLQTYKNKVSKVVILVVIFPDCFDNLNFSPLIISRTLIDLGESAFFKDLNRGCIFCKTDSVDFFDIEFFGHGSKKGLYCFCGVALAGKVFCNVIADFPSFFFFEFDFAKLNIADVLIAIISNYGINKRASVLSYRDIKNAIASRASSTEL